MLVRWEEKYQVGNEQIDREHRYLFQLINQFYDAFVDRRERAILLGLLTRLVDYAETHFTNEEALMKQAGYAALDQHQQHHEKLFEQIFALNARFNDRALNPAHETVLFLKGWLTDHILHDDLRFGAYLHAAAKGQPGQAVTAD